MLGSSVMAKALLMAFARGQMSLITAELGLALVAMLKRRGIQPMMAVLNMTVKCFIYSFGGFVTSIYHISSSPGIQMCIFLTCRYVPSILGSRK